MWTYKFIIKEECLYYIEWSKLMTIPEHTVKSIIIMKQTLFTKFSINLIIS